MKLVSSEYFAGIGLVRMGLEPFGWKIAFANDFSPKKYEMYKAFFPDAGKHYVVQDVFELDPARVPYTTLATCSFPCIDLSLAGNMNGFEGKHSSAFWGFVRILKAQGELAPPVIMVENVPGWLHSNAGADFRTTVTALNELGYACDVFALDALRFTPQSRLRVFLIGVREQVPTIGIDSMLGRPESLLPAVLRKSIVTNLDLKWFQNEIPPPRRLDRAASRTLLSRSKMMTHDGGVTKRSTGISP